MSIHTTGIIMNGVTGRMGTNQHLERSIMAIRNQGGIVVGDDTIMPEPILVGRNEDKLRGLSERFGGIPFTTDLDSALNNDAYSIYFDAQTTQRRVASVKQAIAAGKHIYCEKPTAETSAEALELYRLAHEAGVKNGAVQDKLWLPGLQKLKRLIDEKFFGDILSVRGAFGYWVFTGDDGDPQRPSWNYRKEEGGGIILDMMPHWRYVIDNLFGKVTSLTCTAATHIAQRRDENNELYTCTADDASYSTLRTENGIICHFNTSWTTRVRRDDLVTFQVDGTKGSAVAGLRECLIQSAEDTPRPTWNPDITNTINFHNTWKPMPFQGDFDNAFKTQWELFLRHVVLDEPYRWDLKEAAKGVQLAELAYKSWKSRAWVDVPELD
jgi:predicted dehydrogenase